MEINSINANILGPTDFRKNKKCKLGLPVAQRTPLDASAFAAWKTFYRCQRLESLYKLSLEVKWMMRTSCNLRSNLVFDSLKLTYQPSCPSGSSRLQKLFRKLVEALRHVLRKTVSKSSEVTLTFELISMASTRLPAAIFDPCSQASVLDDSSTCPLYC